MDNFFHGLQKTYWADWPNLGKIRLNFEEILPPYLLQMEAKNYIFVIQSKFTLNPLVLEQNF